MKEDILFLNLNNEEAECYVEHKTNFFETRENNIAKLNTMKEWKKHAELEKEFFELLLVKSENDSDFDKYREKIETGLKKLDEQIKTSEEVIDKVQNIVNNLDYVIDTYFTEEITEEGAIVNETAKKYIEISKNLISVQ